MSLEVPIENLSDKIDENLQKWYKLIMPVVEPRGGERERYVDQLHLQIVSGGSSYRRSTSGEAFCLIIQNWDWIKHLKVLS